MTERPPPAEVWDCHVHVFGPPDRFPLGEPRAYDPDLADAAAAEAMMDRLGVAKAVLVQPSVYGADNACLLDALDRFAGRALGVAVIDPARASGAMLADLRRAGIRGVRLNWVDGDRRLGGQELADRFAALLPLAVSQHWHLVIHAPVHLLTDLAPAIARAPVPVVLDHLAGPRLEADHAEADAALVRDLLAAANIWVKIAAPYRLAEGPAEMDRLTGFIRSLVDSWSDRLLWGSDWPHTAAHAPGRRSRGFRAIDTAALLTGFLACIDDPTAAERILCRNPLALYGSAPGAAP